MLGQMSMKEEHNIVMQPCKAQDTSAPISSSKEEVQKAFPIKRYFIVYAKVCFPVCLIEVELCIREEVLRWNGWGYRDSGFVVNDKGNIEFIGKGRCVD